MPREFIVGDCITELAKISSDSVDVVVTSPPYNKHKHGVNNDIPSIAKATQYDVANDSLPQPVYEAQQVDVLNQCYRIVRPGGSIFYNHKPTWKQGVVAHPLMWFMRSDWTLRQEIIWNRIIAAQVRGWRFHQVDERIYWGIKPDATKGKIGYELPQDAAKQTSVWRFLPQDGRKNPHPAPFPVELPQRCISAVLSSKGVVLDPYSGSGTTALAAHTLGHDFIGIDISAQYTEMAKARLEGKPFGKVPEKRKANRPSFIR